MTEYEFKNLKVGDVVYSRYIKSNENKIKHTVISVWSDVSGNSVILNDIHNNNYTVTEYQHYFLTYADAKKFYINYHLNSYSNGLNKAQQEVDAYLKNIEKLKNSYWEEFPECFI